MAGLVRVPVGRQLRDLYSRTLAWNCLVSVFSIGFAGMILKIEVRSKALPVVKLTTTLSLCITTGIQYVQSWMTIKKTEISAQHEILKPKFLCVLYACIELLYSYI